MCYNKHKYTAYYNIQTVFCTYNVVRPRIGFNASPGTTVRPQLCNDKRFNLCKPINASESIFDIVLSDSTLRKLKCIRLDKSRAIFQHGMVGIY